MLSEAARGHFHIGATMVPKLYLEEIRVEVGISSCCHFSSIGYSASVDSSASFSFFPFYLKGREMLGKGLTSLLDRSHKMSGNSDAWVL